MYIQKTTKPHCNYGVLRRKRRTRLRTQPLLNLGLLLVLDLRQLHLVRIVPRRHLVERVLRALFKLLADLVFALVQAQTLARAVGVHLGETALLERSKGSLEAALGVAVDRRRAGAAAVERERVESVVDAGGADRRQLLVGRRRGRIVELGQVEAS